MIALPSFALRNSLIALSIFSKERQEQIAHGHSLTKSEVSDLLVFKSKCHFRLFALKNEQLKSPVVFTMLLTVFHCYIPFLCPRVKRSRRSLLQSLFAALLVKIERLEQFTHGKEQITILLFHSQKTSDSFKKPKSKFSNLSLKTHF